MNTEKSILTEFLAKSNEILSKVDQSGQLYDLFSPIKNYLQKQEDLLSFSLVRLFGGSTELAFAMEWQTQTSFLMHNSVELFEENQLFWRKKIPVKLRGIPDLFGRIDSDISKIFLPKQLVFFGDQNIKLKEEILKKSPKLSSCLIDFPTRIMAAQFGKSQLLYSENINPSQFLEHLSLGSSFLKIGLPVLAAIRFVNSDISLISNLPNNISNNLPNNSQNTRQVEHSNYQNDSSFEYNSPNNSLNNSPNSSENSRNQLPQNNLYSNSQNNSETSPSSNFSRNQDINWLFLEEILKDISCLYQISNSLDLAKFLYLQSLSETGIFDWWQKTEANCLQILIGQKEIQQEVRNQQQKLVHKIQNDIIRTGLDPKTQNLLKTLSNWAFSD